MAVMVELSPLEREGRQGVWLVASAAASTHAELEAQYDVIEASLREQGLGLADLVRTRLLAASREVRDRASKVRFRRCAGSARCATSSYIEPRFFPDGDGVRLEGLALVDAGRTKIAVEYEPPQPPCRYVATGDLVFCSGVTSVRRTFDEQLAELRPRIAETLRMAGERIGRPVQPTSATAYIHRSVDRAALARLGDRLGLAGVSLAIAACDGYSAPGKLIEVEVDASAG